MAELLLRVLARAGHAINNPFSMGSEYVRPRHGDMTRDFHRVARDMKTVGSDLRKVAKKELAQNGK